MFIMMLPSIFLLLAYLLYTPKKTVISMLMNDYDSKPQKDKTAHIAIWDRTTVDVPNISHLQEYEFEALYFCTTTGELPDLSLIRQSSKVKKINHWEYRTDNKTHLKIYLLFSLYHIVQNHSENVTLHIFTKDEELISRFKIHANGYLLKKLIFKDNKQEQ